MPENNSCMKMMSKERTLNFSMSRKIGVNELLILPSFLMLVRHGVLLFCKNTNYTHSKTFFCWKIFEPKEDQSRNKFHNWIVTEADRVRIFEANYNSFKV
jgi:hypothetical protein